jgi:hypothetical protein
VLEERQKEKGTIKQTYRKNWEDTLEDEKDGMSLSDFLCTVTR